MDFTQKDLINLSSRDFILGNTTVEEQVDFIMDQIRQPFDSGSTNYFKKLKSMVQNHDQMDQICSDLFKQIENVYPSLEFDLSEYPGHLAPVFGSVYKFFVKNINTLMYLFLREYIFNNKNRKGLVADYLNNKLPAYPKEQYGKKEFYILITKLSPIVRSIAEDELALEKFIDYIDRTDDSILCLERVRELIDRGIICDKGVVTDIFHLFSESDSRPGIMNKLEIAITQSLIIPYLKENGLMDIRIVPVADPDEDIEEEDADE